MLVMEPSWLPQVGATTEKACICGHVDSQYLELSSITDRQSIGGLQNGCHMHTPQLPIIAKLWHPALTEVSDLVSRGSLCRVHQSSPVSLSPHHGFKWPGWLYGKGLCVWEGHVTNRGQRNDVQELYIWNAFLIIKEDLLPNGRSWINEQWPLYLSCTSFFL